MFRLLFAFAGLIASPSHAQSLNTFETANNLGSIIGSERACGLNFDQDAIGRWIDQNVDASDMSFPGTLSMMVQGTEFEMQSMGGSALAAQCRSVERTARHYGFIQ